ncbi:MAG: hypothetical protein K2K57_08020 [Oscillospiraceae bacterium]|nr:hypothetical protein [Oscillospiraceae bacterium]
MKNRVVRFSLVIVTGLALSLLWQSSYNVEGGGYTSTANQNAKTVYLKAREYFSGSGESVTGVFTGALSDSDPIGKYLCMGYHGSGYYYLMVKNSAVVQSYWERSGSLSERADELTATLDKGKPFSYINTGGDPVGGYPDIVTECRTPLQRFFDELLWIAYGYIPLLVLLALYVLALLIRPLAVMVWQRFIGEQRQ